MLRQSAGGVLSAFVTIVLINQTLALSDCDNEAGQVCPFSVGKEVGECLQDPSKHTLTDIDGNPRELEPGEEPLKLSDACLAFIKLNEVCDSDISEHCQSMYFHGDTMTCLTQWTKPDVLSEACRSALPNQKSDEEDAVDPEKARWREQRKKAREQAKKDIKKESEAKSPRRKRKSKKKKEL
eukprot:TRINITY_DN5854_c0_g1_i2.p1 TRINITY_DN5854_c0_g1~~TRINITY_DN5854_c0_g1_i2.p1  ORF type:complete len:182 (+),score=48.42 TRINITY_DN5854_c0_g1_i2:101-646(+)